MTLKAQVKAAMEKVATELGGFVSEAGSEIMLFIREGEGMSIILTFPRDENSEPYCETRYKAKGGEYTFDRRGIDASFYFHSVEHLPKQIAEEREKVKAAQARLSQSNKFNLGPVQVMITPERLQQIVDLLKAGKVYQYHPSGFGTGYTFTTTRQPYCRFETAKASAELVRLVGAPIYVSSFDAD